MSIKFTCPNCMKTFNVKNDLAGKRAKCHGCEQVITIPVPQAAPADIEEFAAKALVDQPEAVAPSPEPTFVEFECFYCNEKVKVSVELAGKQTPCPECRRIVKVPLLQKIDPKDWRKVDTRLPSGARENLEPAPEGTWASRSIGTVSKQALIAAQAIPQVRKRLTWQQWSKRGTAVAACAGVIAGIVFTVLHFVSLYRQKQALARVEHYLEEGKEKVQPAVAAKLWRSVGSYYLREHELLRARDGFKMARAQILPVESAPAIERDWILIDLVLAQIELGGDPPDVVKGTHFKWQETHNELRQTLQGLLTAEGRIEAFRLITARLIARNQSKQAGPLASPFSEDSAQLQGVIGLEMLRAKLNKEAESLAESATQQFVAGAAQPQPPAPPSALIALWLALGRQDKAALLAPAPAGNKEADLPVLLGYVEGWAWHGDWELARLRLQATTTWQSRLAVLVALAEPALEADRAAAAKGLEEAMGLVNAEKAKDVSPWLLFRLVKLSVQAGLSQEALALARTVPDAVLRGRAELEVLTNLLSESGAAGDTALQIVDENTPAYDLAVEAIAYHNARLGGASAVARMIDDLKPDFKSFLDIGLARGLQDRGLASGGR